MAVPPTKILVSGDVEGKLSSLFKRVNAVNKYHGPFEMLLCVGDFTASNHEELSKYLDGSLKAPIQTFILGPHRSEDTQSYGEKNGSDLCHNITYLGQSGVFTTSSGLKLVYLSGREAVVNKGNETNFTIDDIDTLQTSLINQIDFKGVDVLVTSQWPKGITKYAVAPEGLNPENCSRSVAYLAQVLKPRYHFAALEGIHYERLPYRNHQVLQEQSKHVTRFIALAKVGNVKKLKWLYAFNIVPMCSVNDSELIKQPQDVTECPYDFSDASAAKEEIVQYFFDKTENTQSDGKKRRSLDTDKSHAKKHPKLGADSCWFCLANPKVEKNLIVSIGTNIYLTIAKGALVDDHILILPIGHFQTTLEMPEDGLDEINQYKIALQKYYKSKDKVAVFFERNFRTPHLQIQVVPLPDKIPINVIKESFFNVADSQSIELLEIPKYSDISQIVTRGKPYFYVELPNGEKLLHKIKGQFPLQFGREVLACRTLLNMQHRVDWKSCTLTAEDEKAMALKFKSSFQSFDFTL